MTRSIVLAIGMPLCCATASAESITSNGTIVVDASKSGGVWWFPQGKDGFDPDQHHQGKPIADYLHSAGWDVVEIARGEDVTNRLSGAAIVIRTGVFFEYRDSEVRAYRDFVASGGSLLLLQGFVRDENLGKDKVASAFGIEFSGMVRSAKIERWTGHVIGEDLDLVPYQIGSVVTRSPVSTIPIAFLSNDRLVMGAIEVGNGKVIFASAVLPLLPVPQPFTERVIRELTTRSKVDSVAMPKIACSTNCCADSNPCVRSRYCPPKNCGRSSHCVSRRPVGWRPLRYRRIGNCR